MAKRIKVKGNPRGLSKLSRVTDYQWQKSVGDDSPMETWPPEVLRAIAKAKGGSTRPSSTRKKRVKEGNRKFIGPRQLRSEIGEDVKARSRDLDYIRGKSPMDVVDYMLKNTNYRQPKKLRAPERRRLSLEDYNPNAEEHSYGLGGIAKSRRLKELLMKLMLRDLGGGQEFDAQD